MGRVRLFRDEHRLPAGHLLARAGGVSGRPLRDPLGPRQCRQIWPRPGQDFPDRHVVGGHLASLAATLGEGRFPRTGGWDEYPATFRAAICVSGAYDIVSLDWGAGWAPPGEPFPDAREYASPIRHVAPGNAPQLILHSDDDPSIPIEQVLRMAAALEAAGAPYRFRRYTDRGHMFITDEAIDEAREFIAEHSG